MSPTLYLTRGLPGSGKTTLARRFVEASDGKLVRLNRDDFRTMMGSGRTHEIEREVTAAQHAAIVSCLRAGRDVIVDDTNLVTVHMRTLHMLGWSCGATVHVIDLDVPLEECLARDADRPAPVGEQVIRTMHKRFLASRRHRPTITRPVVVPGEPYVPDLSKLRTLLVDLDGTTALMNGRGPYDETRYDEDLPNEPVIVLVRAWFSTGGTVAYCSGRKGTEIGRTLSEKWIAREIAVPGPLFMRGADDDRPDHLVKRDLFDQHIRHAYNVVAVLDDRDQVVRMWRGMGLTVLQCAEGQF